MPKSMYRTVRDMDAEPKEQRASEAKADSKLIDDKDFEVPKDFPYKKVGNAADIQELDELSSKVLEEELQNIMIKIWRALPDDAPTEAEQVVAERFRNEAGDDIRNVLGLNVTKRLLNTFNPLMVKVEFNRKPASAGEDFRTFLKWLGCVAMKRVVCESGPHTYVAQLRKIYDFDRVCKRGTVKMGGLAAKITPCYKFTQCPSNLRTVYKEPELSTPPNQIGDSERELDKIFKQEKDATAEKDENQTKKIENTAKKATENPKEVKQAQNETTVIKKAPVTPKSTDQHEFKKPEVPKLVKTPTKLQKNVVNAAKTAKAKADNKPAVTKPKPTVEMPPPAKNVVLKTPPKIESSKKVTEHNVANKNTNKTKVLEQKPVKAVQKAVPKVAVAKKAEAKVVSKTPTKPKLNAKTIAKKGKPKKENDFDELNDEDILALMSDAIVLDECSGSDNEA